MPEHKKRPERRLDNWLTAYGQYTAGTEPPPHFHLWIGMGTLMGGAQRKIFLDADYYRVYSNMYVVLVSEPGIGRKSTALRLGKNILKSVIDYGEEINFSTQASSVAAAVRQMATIKNREHQSLTAYSSELGSLLGAGNIEMVDWLTDVYDCEPDWDKQTISRGLEKIPFPWFNLMAGTTPQWLGDNLPKTAVEGGFVSRTIFVFGESDTRVAFPKMSDEQKALRKDLAHDLAVISQLKGEMRLDDAAHKLYEDWYNSPSALNRATDHRISGYFARKHIHVLKTAMALSLAESDSLVVGERDVEMALTLLENLEPGMHKAFVSVGRNTFSTDLDRIRKQVDRTGGMSYKELIAANIHAVPKDKLDELINSIVDAGWARREIMPGKGLWLFPNRDVA